MAKVNGILPPLRPLRRYSKNGGKAGNRHPDCDAGEPGGILNCFLGCGRSSELSDSS
jgi:hypothetical protein